MALRRAAVAALNCTRRAAHSCRTRFRNDVSVRRNECERTENQKDDTGAEEPVSLFHGSEADHGEVVDHTTTVKYTP